MEVQRVVLLLVALEHVQPPAGGGLARLWRLVVQEHHAAAGREMGRTAWAAGTWLEKQLPAQWQAMVAKAGGRLYVCTVPPQREGPPAWPSGCCVARARLQGSQGRPYSAWDGL